MNSFFGHSLQMLSAFPSAYVPFKVMNMLIIVVSVVVCCIARPCRYSVYPNEGSEQFFYIQEGKYMYINLLYLFDLIIYVPVNNFSVFLCWTSTKQSIKCLVQGHNTVPPVRLKPTTP